MKISRPSQKYLFLFYARGIVSEPPDGVEPANSFSMATLTPPPAHLGHIPWKAQLHTCRPPSGIEGNQVGYTYLLLTDGLAQTQKRTENERKEGKESQKGSEATG
jgi:hypothetical protein